MERHYVTYLLAGLLILLFASVAGYVVMTYRALGRERLKQRDNQVERERRAEQRMVDNGGHALSARSAGSDDLSRPADRSSHSSKAPYPDGHRRPGTSGGSRGWQ